MDDNLIFITTADATKLLTKIQVAIAELTAAVADGDVDDSVLNDLEEQASFLEAVINDSQDD